MNRIQTTLAGIAAMSGIIAAAPAYADGMHWHGEVDDTATITIHKSDVNIDANYHGVKNEHHDFHGELHRGVNAVRLSRVRGRGRVWIVQQPSRDNHFTVIIRIKDPQDGAGKYDFNLDW